MSLAQHKLRCRSRRFSYLVIQGARIPLSCDPATSIDGFQDYHCREKEMQNAHQLLSALVRQ